MANYMIAYHGTMRTPATPEAGQAQMAQWKAWLDALGDAVVNPGSPLGQSRIVTAEGVAEDDWPNSMFGFSIVEADSLEIALGMARACPVVDYGGSLRVAELMATPM